MALWLAREFDWTTGKYKSNYYDLNQAGVVSVFVCSYTGSDVNPGTAALPFKTYTKAIQVLNATGGNGSRLYLNGIFNENFPSHTYWYLIIGVGGGSNGRAVFRRSTGVIPMFYINCRYYNIETLGYQRGYTEYANGFNGVLYSVNCNFRYVDFTYVVNWYSYYCVFYKVRFLYNTSVWNISLRGSNNIFYDCGLTAYYRFIAIYGQFNHIVQITPETFISEGNVDNWLWITKGATGTVPNFNNGIGNIVNIDGQYTDPDNGNFTFSSTSPLLFTGELDQQTGIRGHVGAGIQGVRNNYTSLAFTTQGGAALTNLEVYDGKFRRVDATIAGRLISGYHYLGGVYPINQIEINNVYDFDLLGVTKGVFTSLLGSPRPALTIKIKYGNTTTEVDTCPWLEIEYGKRLSFSGTGVNRIGNGVDTFNPAEEQFINASILRFDVELKDR